GPFDGHFGARTTGALQRFQRFAGLTPDGVGGPGTISALHGPLPRLPIALAWPLRGVLGSRFGPRGAGFHAGVDILAASGTPVAAAASGRVTWAGYRVGGWDEVGPVARRAGGRTMYARLSRPDV